MKKTALLVMLVLVAGFAANASYPVFESDQIEPRVIETDNYRLHLVESHGNTGGELEPLVRVDPGEKRDMVLALDAVNSPRETCKILYDNSLTRHESPCGELP